MANRVIPIETKVKVMNECLRLVNVEEVAARDGVSPGAIHYWFNHKLKPALGDVLVNEPPGPKPQPSFGEEDGEPVLEDRPTICDQCGGTHIWKNGSYAVINWVWLLTAGWLVGLHHILIQRWRCAQCGHELVSDAQKQQAGPSPASLVATGMSLDRLESLQTGLVGAENSTVDRLSVWSDCVSRVHSAANTVDGSASANSA